MFLRRLSAAVVIITCFSWAAMGAVPATSTTATNTGKENSALAPLAVDFGYTIKKPTCNGDTDGRIDITINMPVSGTFKVDLAVGGGAYTPFIASTTSKSFPIPGLRANSYKVRITETSVLPNQSAEQTIVITDFAPLLLSLSQKIDCTCPGSSDGQIILHASDGDNSRYTYSLLPAGGTNLTGNFTGLSANTYTGQVTDGNGCFKSLSNIQIIAPTAITAPAISVDSIDFPGDLAKIILAGLPSDFASKYQIRLGGIIKAFNFSGSTAEITDVLAGTYTLKIERIGCPSDSWTSPLPIEIAAYLPITLTWSPVDPTTGNLSIKCYGGDTTLAVTVNGAKPGVKVKLLLLEGGIPRDLASNLAIGSSYSITGLVAGKDYILFVRTANETDLKTISFRLQGPVTPFQIVGITPTNVTCSGQANGKILVSYAGGTGNISYSLNGGVSFAGPLPADRTIKALGGNASYNLVLRDFNGCLSNDTLVTISEPAPISVSVLTDLTEQLTCPNSNSGSITVRAQGGTYPYNYSLTRDGTQVIPFTPGDSIKIFSGLVAGNYVVSVKDGYCADIDSDTEVIDPIIISLNVRYDSIHCNNETTDLFVSANSTTGKLFTYTLKNNTTQAVYPPQSEISAGAGVTFRNLMGSSYHIGAYYENCEQVTKDTLITNPNPMQVFYQDTVNLNCHGDSTDVTIRASGSSPFYLSTDKNSWIKFSGANSESIILHDLTEGPYSYYVKDRYGCIYNNDAPITIIVKASPAVSVIDGSVVAISESCNEKNDGKISLKLDGGSGRYYVTINNGINSFRKASTNGDFAFTNLPSGTYSFVITDSKNCPAVNPPIPILVDQPDTFKIVYDPVAKLPCFGDSASVKIDIDGGNPVASRVWVTSYGFSSDTLSSGSSFLLKAGNYDVYASNEDGCRTTRSLAVNQPSKLNLEITDFKPVSCNGADDASITITAKGGTPGYSYIISGAGANPVNLTSNPFTIRGSLEAITYRIQLRDANDCQSNIDSVKITEPDVVDFRIRQGNYADSVKCFGSSNGSITITPSGGNRNGYKAFLTPLGGTEREVNYQPSIPNLSIGIYNIRIEDNSHCRSIVKTDTVYGPNEITIDRVETTDSVSCFNLSDASIEIIKTDPLSGLPYGLEYSVTGRDTLGRQVNRGYTTNPVFENLAGSDSKGYTVLIRLRNGRNNCSAPPINIHIDNPKDITIVQPIDVTDVSCHDLQDGSVNIVASGGTGTLSYQLNGLPAGEPNTNYTGSWLNVLGDKNLPSTTYSFIIKDQNQCPKNGSFTVVNPPELIIEEIDHHQVYCNDENTGWIKVQAEGGIGNLKFKKDLALNDTLSLSNNEYTKEANDIYIIRMLTGTTDYQPVVIDKNGCVDTLAEAITIINPPPLRIKNVIVNDKKCFDSKNDSTIIILDPDSCGTRGTYSYSITNWSGTTVSTKEFQGVFVNVRDTLIYPAVRDTMECLAEWPTQTLNWPDPFNVSFSYKNITCWDNQYGSLIAGFEGGTAPYYVGVDDILFTHPEIIERVGPEPVIVDTIVGTPSNNFFYAGVNTDIYVKDSNDCVAMNSPKEDPMNPHLWGSFSWARVDTFKVTEIISNAPNCNNDRRANIKLSIDNKGVGDIISYWVDYPDDGLNGYVTGDSGPNPVLFVFPDKVVRWNISDENNCRPFVPDSIDPAGNREVYVMATSDTVFVIDQSTDDELPICPYTKDGIRRIQMLKFEEKGVKIDVYETDSTFVINNNERPDTSYVREVAGSDTWEIYTKTNPLTGETIPSHKIYSMPFEEPIDFLFTIGYYKIRFTDVNSGCNIEIPFTITAQQDTCPNLFDGIFTPNSDSIHDDWLLNENNLKNASLMIFNSEGEMVYHFPKAGNGFAKGGLRWDGRDDKGRPLPVGTYMYLYKIDIDAKPQWRTITLLRERN